PVTRGLADLLRSEAGEDGRFRIDRMPPGSYALTAHAPGFAPKRVEVDVSPRGGESSAGDVVLDVGLAIRGHVRDKAGQPIGYARVFGFPARPMIGGVRPFDGLSEGDGSFVLAGLSQTSYRLTVQAPGYGQLVRTAEAGTDNLELVLEPAGSITGQVVDDRDRPVETFRVAARPNREATGPGMMITGGSGETITSPDGRFTLPDLAEGNWNVEAASPGQVKATVSGVKVTAGSSTDVGRVRLSGGGTVRGSVVDANGAPILGATVTVQGASREFSRPGESQAFTDSAGLFEVSGVAPGAAEVVARHPQYAEGRVGGLEVDPTKGTTETRVVLSQGGRLEGSARRRDGAGIPGVQVQISPSRGGRLEMGPSGLEMLTTAPDGTFVAEHVPAGRLRLTLMGRQGQG
ncbi:MAG: carboxypeptidase regulatory-like domain-containing protein, partial [Actinomycetota bacterium]